MEDRESRRLVLRIVRIPTTFLTQPGRMQVHSFETHADENTWLRPV